MLSSFVPDEERLITWNSMVSLLGASVVLFLAIGLMHLMIGVLTPVFMGRGIGPQILITATGPDTKGHILRTSPRSW